jgi:osmotically-inducible protein OsmY
MTTLIQRDDSAAELWTTTVLVGESVSVEEAVEGFIADLSDHRPRPTARADAEITAEIRGYLRRGLQVEDTAVDVQVEAGVVLLTGELSRQMFVHRLLERVNGISGVVSVTNRLTARYNDAVVPFAWGFPS